MKTCLLHLYGSLLRWLPAEFRHEFAEELVQVLGQRLDDRASRGAGAVIGAFAGELLALPGLWLVASHNERRIDLVTTAKGNPPIRQASWSATLLAALPLAAAIGVSLLDAPLRRLLGDSSPFLYRVLWSYPMWCGVFPMVFYLIILGGLLAGWIRGFPRWVYPYLGWLLVFVVMALSATRWTDPQVLLTWAPLVATLLLAILLRRSSEPLRALAESWRRDWTLSVLAMVSVLAFLVWATSDDAPGSQVLWMSLSMGVLVIAVAGYMRARNRIGQVVALLGSTLVSLWLNFGAPLDRQSLPILTGWLFWLGVMAILPLLSALLKSLRPPREAPEQQA